VSEVLENARYTEEHEYVLLDDNGLYVVGITDYAQGELGDVVFVNLPKTGEKFDGHQAFGVVEAVKAVSDLYCPVPGEIVAVNDALDADPGLVNRDPYGDGWMIKLRPSDPGAWDRLLSAADYRAHIGE
jgi:glycine cleavage system H protein